MSRTPTVNQHRILLALGSGGALVHGPRRDVGPLVRHGWVVAEDRGDCFAFARITPDGYRALALAVEKYGLPELQRGKAPA